jgi:hypothetical protein
MREVEAVNDNNRNSSQASASSHAHEDLETPAEGTVEAVAPTEGTGGNSPEEDASPVIHSPHFNGFHSPTAESEPSLPEPSPEQETRKVTSAATQNADGDDDAGEQSNSLPQPTEAPSTPLSSVPPNAFNDTPPAMGPDDDLQLLSSPENFVNFNRLLEQLFQGKRPTSGSPVPKNEPGESPKMPRSRSSSSSSFVPNPFYEVDKAHEERLRRGSEKAKGDTVTEEDESAVDSALPKSQLSKTPTSAQPQRSPTPQDQSLMSSIEESNWRSRHNEPFGTQPPVASQLSNIVDLTQSSPPVSPGGSDEDFAKSHRLPRGPGWVQKNVPGTRRRTRLSSAGARPKH